MKKLEEVIQSFDSMNSFNKQICQNLWRDISFNVQSQKLSFNGITDSNLRSQILESLMIRPALLVHIASSLKEEGVTLKTFVEVGTAQGLQSIIFSKIFPETAVYTCDIKDDRDNSFFSCENLKFILGNSLTMGSVLKEKDVSIDFCWIDGGHDEYDVIEDYLSLSPCAHKDTLWAFDDFDSRFGCYKDLNVLMRHFREKVVLNLGLTASGNPNKIVVARGLL